MTYEPLHHKYRPQTFAQLVGQSAIASTLANALRQNRIAPAYLFCGPRGTGKTSSARILAKSLNCSKSDHPTPDPCGVCEICQSITKGFALDIVEIDAASNTGVDNIRELIERAQFAPVQCRYKVYVVDECHMLSTAAFNALLKTLEEPPDRVVFVLATTDPQRVLPTIISRCQRFDFRRIPLEEMVAHLQDIAAKESIDITEGAVRLTAQISQGGMRDAESLLDQLSLLGEQVTIERVWDLVGAVPERNLLTLTQAIAQDDGAAVLDQARHLMDRGREPLIVLQTLAGFYRDLLIAKTAGDRQDLVSITPPTWAELREFVQTLEISDLLAGQQHLRTAEGQVKHTTQPRLWLEVTLLGLLPSALGSQETEDRRQKTGDRRQETGDRRQEIQVERPKELGGKPVAKPSLQPTSVATAESLVPQASEPVAKPFQQQSQQRTEHSVERSDSEPSKPLSPDAPVLDQPPLVSSSPVDLQEAWRQVIAKLQPFGTQALLRQQGRLLSFDGQTARIGINSKQLFKMAQGRVPNMEAAFEQVFTRKIKVSLEVAVSETEPVSAPAAAPPPAPKLPPPNLSPSVPSPMGHGAPPPQAHPSPHPSSASFPGEPVSPPAAISPPPQPAPSAPSKTESIPSASLPPAWQADGDLERSVKSFAQFFNGQIVNLEDDLDPSSEMTSQVKSVRSKSGDDTVPF
ncbi:MAG: DNA polymerase III subunit gamma/tau [Leptolyngbyaceae cyanobacterium MO_188.B28]|nr:DNA polymerase III subunit gamma/tau [Leptolyngbyaceae cyanobacterium MO_188.B28]